MQNHNTTTLVILACGRGTRSALKEPKQYCKINNKSLLRHTIESFLGYQHITNIVVVINKEDIDLYNDATAGYILLPPIIGGESRQESLENAVFNLQQKPNKILVHDACRPFVSFDMLDNLFEVEIAQYECIFPAIPISETMVDIEKDIYLSVSRENKYLIQTPQLIDYNIAYEIFSNKPTTIYTDESSLFIAYNKSVKQVNGEKLNFKITYPEDLKLAAAILREKMITKIGIGYDVHKFKEENADQDNFIILGGIKIPHYKSIEAHSDGDVLLHAVTDAILGAMGDGDIGDHFPPSDDKWKNADSKIFIQYACDQLKKLGGEIVNIDIVIACQNPKISPFKNSIKENIANMIQICNKNIGVKATTTEKLGFIGREEGISVQAIANIIIQK